MTSHLVPDLISSRFDDMNRNAVHWAALGGYHEMLRLLIQYKCDPSLPDHAGDTALQLASWYCHLEVSLIFICDYFCEVVGIISGKRKLVTLIKVRLLCCI